MFHPGREPDGRADLAHSALDVDMVLTASADQSALSPLRQATKWTNTPPLVCPPCDPIGTPDGGASSSDAAPGAAASGSSCAMGTGDATGWIAFGLGFVAFATVRRRRR